MVVKKSARKKAGARKVISRDERIGIYGHWAIYPGELKRKQGRPNRTERLFKALAEKLPKDSLSDVCGHLSEKLGHRINGVYVAHDSMGYPRYIGRGDIRTRLSERFRVRVDELMYYSFYVVQHKIHEREIETLLIRAAGSLLDFNDKKKRSGIQTGSPLDFEVGTYFYERRRSKKSE
jgi:hypothetical protein